MPSENHITTTEALDLYEQRLLENEQRIARRLETQAATIKALVEALAPLAETFAYWLDGSQEGQKYMKIELLTSEWEGIKAAFALAKKANSNERT